MSGKKKPTVPSSPEPAGLDLSETVGLVFSFFWFHRGILFAVLALFGLYQVLSMAKDKVADNKQRDAERAPFVFVPPSPVEKSPPESPTGERLQDRVRETIVAPVPLVERTPAKNSFLQEDEETIRFRKFVAKADVETLLRRSVLLLKEVPQLTPPEAVMNITRRQRMSERLRQMDLTPAQTEELEIADLESLSQLDAINVQHGMGIDDLRPQLLERATSLLDHPQTTVSTKAHLAMVASCSVDLLIDPTRNELELLRDAYQTHIDYILQGNSEAVVVAELLQQIVAKHQFDEAIELRRDLANRVLGQSPDKPTSLEPAVRERIVFGDLRLESLINRMEASSQTTLNDIDLFYQRLERFPEVRKEVFTRAVEVIEKHVEVGEFDAAVRLLDWMTRIQLSIPDPETRIWVKENLTQYSEQIRLARVAQ